MEMGNLPPDRPAPKPAIFIGSALGAIRSFPDRVRQKFGGAIWDAQNGEKAASAKPLKGHRGAGVLEIVEGHDTDTYRAVYTVRFTGVVYVLHAFQKKSSRGSKTSAQDLALVEDRLRQAEQHYTQVFLPQRMRANGRDGDRGH